MSEERADLAALASHLGDLARRLGANDVTQDLHADDAAPADGQESSTGASSPGPLGLRTVRVASELAEAAAAALRLSVDLARAAGRTWQELGDVLGVSRQAAFQRFGHPIDPRTGERCR